MFGGDVEQALPHRRGKTRSKGARGTLPHWPSGPAASSGRQVPGGTLNRCFVVLFCFVLFGRLRLRGGCDRPPVSFMGVPRWPVTPEGKLMLNRTETPPGTCGLPYRALTWQLTWCEGSARPLHVPVRQALRS